MEPKYRHETEGSYRPRSPGYGYEKNYSEFTHYDDRNQYPESFDPNGDLARTQNTHSSRPLRDSYDAERYDSYGNGQQLDDYYSPRTTDRDQYPVSKGGSSEAYANYDPYGLEQTRNPGYEASDFRRTGDWTYTDNAGVPGSDPHGGTSVYLESEDQDDYMYEQLHRGKHMQSSATSGDAEGYRRDQDTLADDMKFNMSRDRSPQYGEAANIKGSTPYDRGLKDDYELEVSAERAYGYPSGAEPGHSPLEVSSPRRYDLDQKLSPTRDWERVAASIDPRANQLQAAQKYSELRAPPPGPNPGTPTSPSRSNFQYNSPNPRRLIAPK
ncbi:hypothetical protein HDU96_005303 [Phlyctochytrium bullatum]|nr:hypothetical protein HDU96_005303 [Phlyctochytrium bullatum]